MGLLLSHKRTCKISVDMITFSAADNLGGHGGGKRGEIDGFSRAARKRMIELLHRVKFSRFCMVTLTYPGIYPGDPRTWKKNLKEYRRRFEKRWGEIRGIWRLELQKRGAPHFHILYLEMPFIPIAEIQDLWYGVIHTPYPMRVGNAVDLETMPVQNNKRLAMAYLSKYIAKLPDENDEETPPKMGRIWGYWNLKEEESFSCLLYEREAEEIATIVMSMWSKKFYIPDDLTLCSLYGEELGTGEFQETVKRIISEVVTRRRAKPTNFITFETCI